MITLIEKIENENGFFKFTTVGYTQDEALIIEINEAYDVSLGTFLAANRTKLNLGEVSINEFFDVTPSVNEARTQTDSVEGLEVTEITNINQL
jgi:hypothetical protein